MKKMKRSLMALLMVCVLVLSSMTVFADSNATTWYVNGGYTGDSDGSEDAPFTTIQEAIAVATNDSTIKIYAFDGEYDAFTFSNVQGLTFEGVAVNGEKPVIACGKTAVSWWVSGVMGSGNVTDTTFTGIEFKNYGQKQSWVDSCIMASQNSGADWEGLVISDCDFILVEGTMGYAVAPCCGEFTMTGCTIKGFENGICLMDDGGALVDVTITDNVIEVDNEVVNGYWGAESPADVTSTVTITGNDLTSTDGETIPVINLIDYAYQQGKTTDAIDVIVIENNTGDAEAVLTNMNKVDVAVKDMEMSKSFANTELAEGSAFIEEGEAFYIRYDANADDNTVYELTEDGSVAEHTICTPELQGKLAATCTEAGYTGDEVCTLCGKVTKTGEEIKATGHKEVLVGAKEATTTDKGYTGDKVCDTCKTVLEKGKEIPVKVAPSTTSPKTGDVPAVGLYVVIIAAVAAAVGGFRMKKVAR